MSDEGDSMFLPWTLRWWLRWRLWPRVTSPFKRRALRFKRWRCGRRRVWKGFAHGHRFEEVIRLDDYKAGIGHIECRDCGAGERFLYNRSRQDQAYRRLEQHDAENGVYDNE